MTVEDRAGFIKSTTRLQPVGFIPELSLYQAADLVAVWEAAETHEARVGLSPPYWAVAWAGGLGLARYVLDHPELITDARVLDFAAGSGLVGLAARKAGAREVVCVDLDPFALTAIALNAEANDLAVAVKQSVPAIPVDWCDFDILLCGDIFYDREVAPLMLRWLQALSQTGQRALVGDPGRKYLPAAHLQSVATYTVPVSRQVESADIKEVQIWQIRDMAP